MKSTKAIVLMDGVDSVLDSVAQEVMTACEQFPPLNSPHEAYAVILEELDEFKELVYRNKGGTKAVTGSADMQKELVQVAAMAVRAIIDITAHVDEEEPPF